MGRTARTERRRDLIAPLLFLVAFVSVSCARTSVNVVRAAGLTGTVTIEIDENDLPGVAIPRHVAITDPASVRAIVSALDTNVLLLPRTRCPDVFTVRFRLHDGRVEEFGYSCDPQPSFLRGNQPFWDGKEIRPPERFDMLVQEQIRVGASAGPLLRTGADS